MFRGYVGDGPLEGDPFSFLEWKDPVVTFLFGPSGRRLVSGSVSAAEGGYAVVYYWTWGIWLTGAPFAAAGFAPQPVG